MVSNCKKDLEIVYNLQWKNSSGHGDDKANIVGMYDIPATTLTWETFKSYLLKNSGATVNDVRVYYIRDDQEICIESQLDFQLALYEFRQRARNGDINNLRLERISDQSRLGRIKRLRRSADMPAPVEVGASGTVVQNDNPPDWFKKYMKGFKKEVVEEVATSVMNYLSNAKVQNSTPPCYHSRKSKMECCKRPRKVSVIIGKPENDHRALLKSLKLERKLDNKLEKLEHKTIKLKEKKLALIRSSDEDSRSSGNKSRPIGVPLSDTELLMNASSVGHHESVIPRMSGGETYHQEWQVINSGDLSWTENTELRFAWGSEALKPLERSVPCPPLHPGEKGIVSVYLEIPKKHGNYESYWHFYHEGRRFGHWLGCRVIVEPSPVKLPPSSTDTFENENDVLVRNWSSTPKKLEIKQEKDFVEFKEPINIDDDLEKISPLPTENDLPDDLIMKLNNLTTGLKVYDSNSSSDSDNQSIISIADSNSSGHSPSDEFVVVPIMSECLDNDEKTNVEEKKVSSGNLCIPICSDIKLEKIDNTTNENKKAEENKAGEPQQIEYLDFNEAGYAFVNVDGKKIAVPKRLLRSDYLATAEEAPAPLVLDVHQPTASSPTPTIDSLAPTINTSTTPSIILPKEENNKDIIYIDDSITHESQTICESKQQESVSSTVKDSPPNAENIDNAAMSSSRLFMFPSNIPGFEVFPTPKSFTESLPPESSMTSNVTNQTSSIFNVSSNVNPAEPFYQYGYCQSPATLHNPTENVYGFSYSYPHSHLRESYHPYSCGIPCNDPWFPTGLAIPPENPNQNGATKHYPLASGMKYCQGPSGIKHYATHTIHQRSSSEVDSGQVSGDSNQNIPAAASKPPSPPAQSPNLLYRRSTPVTMLPNTLVSGAVNVASSAINTARSVINMFSPPASQPDPVLQDQWENGWSPNEDTPREKALHTLHDMGFWDRNLNTTLLIRYNNDLTRVIADLVN